MHYDITKLSDDDAQTVGYALKKFLSRLEQRIEMANENLAFQSECSRKYGQSFWQRNIDETTKLLSKLTEEYSKVSKVYSLIIP